MQDTLILIVSVAIALWGVGHLFPTAAIVKAFEPTSRDNRLTITMEWIAEGLTLIFIGGLGFFTVVRGWPLDVPLALAAMLLVMAALSAFTGARTSVLPMKLCPFVETAIALVFVVAVVV
ncbi:MAG: hypothetical protein ABR978_09405 [Dehalococcoidia bacterium]|jgi:hypothetical protein